MRRRSGRRGAGRRRPVRSPGRSALARSSRRAEGGEMGVERGPGRGRRPRACPGVWPSIRRAGRGRARPWCGRAGRAAALPPRPAGAGRRARPAPAPARSGRRAGGPSAARARIHRPPEAGLPAVAARRSSGGERSPVVYLLSSSTSSARAAHTARSCRRNIRSASALRPPPRQPGPPRRRPPGPPRTAAPPAGSPNRATARSGPPRRRPPAGRPAADARPAAPPPGSHRCRLLDDAEVVEHVLGVVQQCQRRREGRPGRTRRHLGHAARTRTPAAGRHGRTAPRPADSLRRPWPRCRGRGWRWPGQP